MLPGQRTSIGSVGRQSVAELRQKMMEEDIMEATSFHQMLVEDKENLPSYLIFNFKWIGDALGSWTLLLLILLASIFTVANGVIIQVVQEIFMMNVGEILFFRSLLTVIFMAIAARGTPILDLNVGEDRKTVLIGSVTLSIANITFVMCLTNISIAAAFCCVIMIQPVALIVEKNWRFPFTSNDYIVFVLCLIGLGLIGIPWHGHHMVGILLGLVTLFLIYFYEVNSKSLVRQMNLIKMVFLSNLIITVISIPILIALRPTWLHLATVGLIALMTLFYLLSLELIFRINTAFKDEFVHVVFYLHVFLGFAADYFLKLEHTSLYNLAGAFLIVIGSYYGTNKLIFSRFWNVLRHGTPQAPMALDGH